MSETVRLSNFASIANAVFNSVSANATAVTAMTIGGTAINATAFAGTANNATNLGGVAAASYALLAGPTFTGAVNVTGNMIATGIVSVGNSTVNAFANSTHLVFNSTTAQAIGIFKPTANGSRIDIVSGANNASNPFWNGLHIGPPGAFTNATSGTVFPRASHFYSFTNATNPSDLTYNIIPGNDGGIGTALKLYSVSTSGVVNGIDIVANGHVGIGTTAPGARLSVSSASGVQIEAFNGPISQRVGYCGFGSVFSGSATAHPYVLLVNDSERMRIDTSGNVGIGTNSPSRRLELELLGAFRMQTGSVVMDCTPTAGATDAFIWNTSANAIYNWSHNGTTRMVIDGSGNVGIGTSSPTARLTVAGGFLSTGNIQTTSQFITATFGTAYVQAISTTNSGVTQIINDGGAGYLEVNGTTAIPLLFRTQGIERARITAAGDFQFNSGYGSVATAFGCRAWVNFNGTGTVAIRGSGNVSSISDNGTGDYTVNFTTAMPDRNYVAVVGNGRNDTGYVILGSMTTPTASAYRVTSYNAFTTQVDGPELYVAIIR